MKDSDQPLTGREFERWIKASHDLFELFEGRYDAYPLSRKWTEQWISNGEFVITKGDVKRLNDLITGFNYENYNVKSPKLIKKINYQFKSLIEKHFQLGQSENVGVAIVPYLFTWNFQRFKVYYSRRNNFDLDKYFEELGNLLETVENELRYFETKKLLDEINKERIKSIFTKINYILSELGINNNEPVGTIKLLHIFAPSYFPLIDNKIAKGIDLIPPRGESINSDTYIRWMELLSNWLQKYPEVIEKIESELDCSILKLVDEALYLMSSVNMQLRVRRLGIEKKVS